MLFVYIICLLVGFAALLKGADVFVDGSCGLARRFNVPGLVIGLTIVSMGTSAPELAVSTVAAIQGSNEIALSNVVGSNIFNLLMVLGICAMIKPLPVDAAALKRDYPFSIISALIVFIMSVVWYHFSGRYVGFNSSDEVGLVSRTVGVVILVVFIIYLAVLFLTSKKDEDCGANEEKMTLKKCLILIFVGLIMVVTGGQAVVYGARNIALTAGLSETLIGLTIVAVGTSLPELMTSIVAARKGETGLAVGNVLGSNIFNMLFILGVSSSVHPIAVNGASAIDLLILMTVSLVAYLFSYTNKKIGRIEGLVMVAIYIADVIYAIIR